MDLVIINTPLENVEGYYITVEKRHDKYFTYSDIYAPTKDLAIKIIKDLEILCEDMDLEILTRFITSGYLIDIDPEIDSEIEIDFDIVGYYCSYLDKKGNMYFVKIIE